MTDFVDICGVDDLVVERGAGALLGDVQIALFKFSDGSVHAVQQHDPYSGANVLSRGIVGTHRVTGDDGVERDVPTLTSPMLKQVWDLESGAVIDSGGKAHFPLDVYPVDLDGGRVRVASVPEPKVES